MEKKIKKDEPKKKKLDIDRREELADFLRTRRERIKPSNTFARRRTPGLRREEVAELAGVGVSWYTWLEQGRDIQPSAELLTNLSKALQLTTHETRYLFLLADRQMPQNILQNESEIPDSVRRFVCETLKVPAFVMDERFNIRVVNDHFKKSFYDIEKFTEEDRNWLFFVFTKQRELRLNDSWETSAKRALAEFRLSVGDQISSSWAKDLIKRLSKVSPEFTKWWKSHEVLERRSLTTEIQHAQKGKLKYERSVYIPTDAENLRINIITPL